MISFVGGARLCAAAEIVQTTIKDGEMNKHFRTFTIAVLFTLTGSGLLAYETENEDKKIGAPAEFKVDGVIFSGYENQDENEVGEPDAPANTGFQVNRAYINVRGKIKDGGWKGLAYRVTGDFGGTRASGEGATGSPNNDYLGFLKFAYVDLPLFSGAALRLGQQGIPLIEALDPTFWEHRYITQSAPENVGATSSTDQGLSFLYANPWVGFHLLYGNGEAFRRGNAERFTHAGVENLTALSKGTANSGDSYGQDVYGNLTIKPTGENANVIFALNFPFRFQNVAGVHQDEYSYAAATIDTTKDALSDNFQWEYLRGSKRALQDSWYGSEADLTVKTELVKFTVGAGTMVHRDQRGTAVSINETTFPGHGTDKGGTIDFSKFQNIDKSYRYENDVFTQANYGFAHVAVGQFGAFYRIIQGDGTSGRLSGARDAGRDRWLTYAMADLYAGGSYDETLGDLSYSDLKAYLTNRGENLSKQTYQKYLYGVTWIANPRFRISLGVEDTINTDMVFGYQNKVHPLSRVRGKAAATESTTLDSQVGSNTRISYRTGLPNKEPLPIDQLGKNRVERQIFVRSEYSF